MYDLRKYSEVFDQYVVTFPTELIGKHFVLVDNESKDMLAGRIEGVQVLGGTLHLLVGPTTIVSPGGFEETLQYLWYDEEKGEWVGDLAAVHNDKGEVIENNDWIPRGKMEIHHSTKTWRT